MDTPMDALHPRLLEAKECEGSCGMDALHPRGATGATIEKAPVAHVE